jgi:hypothetical protein
MLNSKIKMNVICNFHDDFSVVYWFDRLEKQEKGDKISIFFEMTGAGLGHLDMEFVISNNYSYFSTF